MEKANIVQRPLLKATPPPLKSPEDVTRVIPITVNKDISLKIYTQSFCGLCLNMPDSLVIPKHKHVFPH